MPEAGWYPDPAGSGGLRYWDGSAWSADTDDTLRPSAWQRVKGPIIIGLVTVLSLLALLFALERFGIIGGDDEGPSNPTEFCPRPEPGNASADAHPDDGRVHGGLLSFPALPPPWSLPYTDNRVPLGRDAWTQSITIEQNYEPGMNWVASVLVAELVSADGFGSPRSGMDIVSRCILGAFYSDHPVERKDLRQKDIVVDGREANLLEMQLSFDIPNVQAKGERVILVVVNTGPQTWSLYYASIPDNAQQYLPTAQALVGKLQVDR